MLTKVAHHLEIMLLLAGVAYAGFTVKEHGYPLWFAVSLGVSVWVARGICLWVIAKLDNVLDKERA